jgi:hypothetical protein
VFGTGGAGGGGGAASFSAFSPRPDTAAIPDDILSIIANTREAAFLSRCIFLSTR